MGSSVKLGSWYAWLGIALLVHFAAPQSHAATSHQAPPQSPARSADRAASKPTAEKNPAQIELLETKVRFETNGDSRKEVHARVRINNELGVRQFARLNFDFNRSFQSVEIPLVRITHASGGTADILPGSITDHPNPAVVDFPAYHDVRVKSVRILGLQPDDTLEYRVVTTTTGHPLAPDFWLDHTFDRSGVVSRQELTLELPAGRGYVSEPGNIPGKRVTRPDGGSTYTWTVLETTKSANLQESQQGSDVTASTFANETSFQARLSDLVFPLDAADPALSAKAAELVKTAATPRDQLRALYLFVAQRITTVDLPVGATGFRLRAPGDVLKSGAGTQEDKAKLLAALAASAETLQPFICLAFRGEPAPPFYGLPAQVQHLLLTVPGDAQLLSIWMDTGTQVAPFNMISSAVRGKSVMCLAPSDSYRIGLWEKVPDTLPFDSAQKVAVQADFSGNGALQAKVHYTLRGDNELLLRVAFFKTEKEKWKDVAQMLALSDGFRGDVTHVTGSDPSETEKPFEVEYEITQPKFADWSKKTHRIPALLPLPGLPDPPAAEAISKSKPIELGTPLAIELESTIVLPEGAAAQAPIGTSVTRDYATYSSTYSADRNVLHAVRKLNFLMREIPASRAADFNAFLHAVQADQSQLFTVQTAPSQK